MSKDADVIDDEDVVGDEVGGRGGEAAAPRLESVDVTTAPVVAALPQ